MNELHSRLKKSEADIASSKVHSQEDVENHFKAKFKQDFVKNIEKAEKEFEAGNYQTIDEVEKESESW